MHKFTKTSLVVMSVVFASATDAQVPDVASCATEPVIASNVRVVSESMKSPPTVAIFFSIYGVDSGSPRINTLELMVNSTSEIFDIEGANIDFMIDGQELSVAFQMSYEQVDWMPDMFPPRESASWGLAPNFPAIVKDASDASLIINSKEGDIVVSLSDQEFSTIKLGLTRCMD